MTLGERLERTLPDWDEIISCNSSRRIWLGGDGGPFPNIDYTFVYSILFVDDYQFGRYPTLTITESETSNVIRAHTITSDNEYSIGSSEIIPGNTYIFDLCAYGQQSVKVDLTLEEVDPTLLGQPTARPTAGLRLSRIENLDAISINPETRTFDYGYGGYFVSNAPNYIRSLSDGPTGPTTLMVSSTPTRGIGPSFMPIAYEKVDKWLGTPTSNTGRIESHFTHKLDNTASLTVGKSEHSTRTTIRTQNYFDSNGIMVKSEDYTYNSDKMGEATGFKAKKSTKSSTYRDYEWDFSFANFTISSNWRQFISKTTKTYMSSGDLTEVVTYEYDDKLQHTYPVKEIVVNSNGEELSKDYTYPMESSSCASCYTTYISAIASCKTDADEDVIDESQGDIEGNLEDCQRNVLIAYQSCLTSFDTCLENEYAVIPDSQTNAKAIALLNVWNLISIPLETKTSNETTELNKTILQYDRWDRSGLIDYIPLPKSTSVSYQGGTPVEMMTVHEYDSRGNPLEVFDHKKGYLISFIWGYNSTYPVAKLENATYQDALSEVARIDTVTEEDDDTCTFGGTCNEQTVRDELNALRTLPALAGALITTYTYDRGVGMTSQTDPDGTTTYYQYDSFGRLKQVIDKDGKMVSAYEYNYRN
ncbi:MAG: RHS repeat protein [Cytophagales bacterium]|nr:RHS repeat protein [Cytophagales bacterium]